MLKSNQTTSKKATIEPQSQQRVQNWLVCSFALCGLLVACFVTNDVQIKQGRNETSTTSSRVFRVFGKSARWSSSGLFSCCVQPMHPSSTLSTILFFLFFFSLQGEEIQVSTRDGSGWSEEGVWPTNLSSIRLSQRLVCSSHGLVDDDEEWNELIERADRRV